MKDKLFYFQENATNEISQRDFVLYVADGRETIALVVRDSDSQYLALRKSFIKSHAVFYAIDEFLTSLIILHSKF